MSSLVFPSFPLRGQITLRQGIALLFLCFGALYCAGFLWHSYAQFAGSHGFTAADGSPLGGDFAAFWSVAQMLHDGRAAQIYDATAFNAAVAENFEEKFGRWPYPPPMSLVLWPLGFLPYLPAFFLWSALGMAALAQAAGDRRLLWLMPLAPPLLYCLDNGQNGLFFAALLLAGLRLGEKRPVVAGICFGCMLLKPQMALLLPICLLAKRQGRVACAALLTALALVGMSLLFFGWESWRDFFTAAIPGHSATMLGTHSRLGMPTVYMFVLMLADTKTAILVQALMALSVAALAWRVFRTSQDFTQNLAVFALGTFLMTPYGFIYDLPLVGVALLALLARLPLKPLPITLFGLVWLLPFLHVVAYPAGPVFLLALFVYCAGFLDDFRLSTTASNKGTPL